MMEGNWGLNVNWVTLLKRRYGHHRRYSNNHEFNVVLRVVPNKKKKGKKHIELMEHFPLLPGYSFHNLSPSNYAVPQKLQYKNGCPVVKTTQVGLGGCPLDIESVRYVKNPPSVLYDKELTYNDLSKSKKQPPFIPHFVKYDKKCLSFKGYFTQEVFNSPDEIQRIRKIEFIYFLEDDTILVREPAIENAGFPQGRLATRGKILKNDGTALHWKDLNTQMKITINGTEYCLCSCDRFTREFLESQGIEVEDNEIIPEDPYIARRTMFGQSVASTQKPFSDGYIKFLKYNKKILRFTGVWTNQSCESKSPEQLYILFYPEDDTMEILKSTNRRECEPSGPLLSRIKVPKNWKELYAVFPAECLDNYNEHRSELYQPKDLIVGETIDVFGRKVNLIDCDNETRSFYKTALNLTQPLPVLYSQKPEATRPTMRVTHRTTTNDILPEWHKFTPKVAKMDLVRYLDNMNKILRYTAKMEVIHPENEGRRFVFEYRLSDGCLRILEQRQRNTGFLGGKFLNYQLVPKPNSNPECPQFYAPEDLEQGGVVNIFGHRFVITGADLAVYSYMMENTEKFTPEAISNLRDYLISNRLLDEHPTKLDAQIIGDTNLQESTDHLKRETGDRVEAFEGLDPSLQEAIQSKLTTNIQLPKTKQISD